MKTTDIFRLLENRLNGKVVVVGIGNYNEADDGAGVHLVDKLTPTERLLPLPVGESPEYHVSDICDLRPDVVMFVDAVDLDCTPGSIAIVEKSQLPKPWGNAHQPVLSTIMDFISERTAADTFLLAVQPHEIASGTYLTPLVSDTVSLLSEHINELAARTDEY